MDIPGDHIPRKVQDYHVKRIELGPRFVSCQVTPRWLEFKDVGRTLGRLIARVDVMTSKDTDDGSFEPYKLCEVFLSLEDLRGAVLEMEGLADELEGGTDG